MVLGSLDLDQSQLGRLSPSYLKFIAAHGNERDQVYPGLRVKKHTEITHGELAFENMERCVATRDL
jgi:hypothetical protein